MFAITYIHHVKPYGHCATICSDKQNIIIAYYHGPECSNQQAVNIELWHNDKKVSHKVAPSKTGNCVLVRGSRNIYLVFSRFEDKDEDGNTPYKPVQRWMYCSNWCTRITHNNNTLRFSKPQQLKFNPRIGYLTRCNPIIHENTWYLPIYREHNCYGLILKSKDGRRWTIGGTIGKDVDQDNGRFGKGILIQPTIWHDGKILHSLSRDISKRNRAWYSTSNNDGITWTEPITTNVWNNNNSVVTIQDQTSAPLMIWNEGPGRFNLVLGQWSQEELTAKPYLKLNRSSNGSYPNYCIDHIGRLHIVHSDLGPIIRHVFDQEALHVIKTRSQNQRKILMLSDIPTWKQHE